MAARSLVIPIAASLVSVFTLQPEVQAQVRGPWIELRAGYLGASDDLGRTPLVDQSFAIFVAEVEAVPSFGFGLGLPVSDRMALRITAERSLYAAATGFMQCAPFVTCAADIRTVPVHVRRWDVGLDAQLRPETDWLPFNPVMSAGVGARRTQTAWWQPESVYSDAHRAADVSLIFRVGIGGERIAGPVNLFFETAATAGRVGEPAQQFFEGAFSDSRRTNVLLSLSGGVRYHFR
jgi:hypothetical protein